MSELRVSAWKRYGHSRLYVKDLDGNTVAWFDRKTGHLELKVPELRNEVLDALAPYLTHLSASSSGSTTADPRIRPASAPPPEYDLALNKPGDTLHPMAEESSSGIAGRALAWLLRRPTRTNSWRTGLVGERIVGKELQRLSRHGWYALHSIPLSPANDIDHLLIGPGGVFTINTKNHKGMSIWVGDDSARINHGEPRPYTRKSRAEARRAARTLERGCGFAVVVMPLLVFIQPARLDVAASLTDVRALSERELGAYGPSAGVLTPEQVETVYSVARDLRNWARA